MSDPFLSDLGLVPSDSDIQLLQEQSYQVVGACIAVHREMGASFDRELYVECLEEEMKFCKIPYRMNPEVSLSYRERKLSVTSTIDFICFENTLVRVESIPKLFNQHRPRMRHFLKQAQAPQGIIANFGASPKLRWETLMLHLPEEDKAWEEESEEQQAN